MGKEGGRAASYRVHVRVDFEGGGRIMCDMTDRDPDEVKTGMPVEMTFRKLHFVDVSVDEDDQPVVTYVKEISFYYNAGDGYFA